MKLRNVLALGLSVSLVFGLSGNIYAAATDYEGHWAQKQISRWLEKGWLTGFADGSVKPNQEISRAEFVTLINRSFEIRDGSTAAVFSDLPETSWAYSEFSKAIGAGYIEGYEGAVRPNAPISRQETAIIIFRLMKFEAPSQVALPQFSDSDQIAAWSRAEVTAAVHAGVMKGYPDGRFAPAKALTRAEAVALLDNLTIPMGGGMPDATVTTPAVLGESDSAVIRDYKNVTVSTYGVTLQNLVIHGDLLLGEDVGEGEITLSNVNVKGKVFVQGGGAKSVHLKNSSLEQIMVQKKNGTVRLVAEGTTHVKAVSVQSGVKLEENGGTGAGFTNVELTSALPAGSVVALNGTFENIVVEAKAPVLQLLKGSVTTLNAAANASGLKVELGEGTTVARAVLNAVTNIMGAGRVLAATVNEGGKGSAFASKPAVLDGSHKDTLIIPAALPPVTVNGGGNSNTGGNNSSGGNTPAPASIPLISGITARQYEMNMYTNAATILLSLEGVAPAVLAAADHPGYYYTAAAESAPDPGNVYTDHLPDMSLRFSFPVSPENLKDYMTVILYDRNDKAIGYSVVKLDLNAKHTVLQEPAVRFTSGVAITREVKDSHILDRIAVDSDWMAQHPEAKYYTYTGNSELPFIADAVRDFNIKHVSSEIQYLEKVTNVTYGISYESYDDYISPFYTILGFQEQYMIVFYDDEMNVVGYYQAASVLTDQQAADTVAFKIAKLPAVNSVTAKDKAAVNWAYGRYMGLTDGQKALLEEEAVNKIIALKRAVDLL